MSKLMYFLEELKILENRIDTFCRLKANTLNPNRLTNRELLQLIALLVMIGSYAVSSNIAIYYWLAPVMRFIRLDRGYFHFCGAEMGTFFVLLFCFMVLADIYYIYAIIDRVRLRIVIIHCLLLLFGTYLFHPVDVMYYGITTDAYVWFPDFLEFHYKYDFQQLLEYENRLLASPEFSSYHFTEGQKQGIAAQARTLQQVKNYVEHLAQNIDAVKAAAAETAAAAKSAGHHWWKFW